MASHRDRTRIEVVEQAVRPKVVGQWSVRMLQFDEHGNEYLLIIDQDGVMWKAPVGPESHDRSLWVRIPNAEGHPAQV